MKSLYPSLQAEQSAAIVAGLVRESNLKVEGIHWDEAVLYLALTLAKEKVDELKLQEVIPAWKKAGGRGRRPGITTKEVKGPLQEDKDWSKSLFNPSIHRRDEQLRRRKSSSFPCVWSRACWRP